MHDHPERVLLEQQLRDGHAAKFIEAVEKASSDADTLLLTLGAFAGEPGLLYTALRYASRRGVTVRVVPQQIASQDAA